jgi:hypothetical protein
MAAVSKAKEVAKEPELVEVEHFAGAPDSTFNGPGFRVRFIDGKAVVLPEQVKFLKEAGVIK